MREVLGKGFNLLRMTPARLRSWKMVRALSRRRPAPVAMKSSLENVRDAVSMLMTFKVENDDRASILDVVLGRLERDLAETDLSIHIADASPDPYAGRARSKAATVSRELDYRHDDRPMTLSYLDVLDACSTPYCYLQFDDQLTTNLSPDFLLAACRLLERHRDFVPIVTVTWPLQVRVKRDRREITVVTHRRRRSPRGRASYDFGLARRRRPIVVDEIDGYRFGIFENFYYGFYFNHLITRPDDYARRLRWYLDEVNSLSVHDIEISARYRTHGPFWTHIAVCLDGVSLLDVGYSHTGTSIRPETATARDVHRALSQGFDIKTFATGVGELQGNPQR